MSLKTLENRGLSPILADFADFGGLSPILILVVCPRFCRFCAAPILLRSDDGYG